ncbi:MAG: cytochrome c oxidase subunit II [Actinomycetales bacterium]|nr:cytochrome c oxidase subunit II [Actinomycetales bacterium]
MSTVDQRPLADPEQPEEPTNRPAPRDRFREWIARPYARRIVILTVILTLLIVPVAFLVLHFMNLSGGPASPVMYEIEKTMFVFTVVSAPLMAVTLAILLYSLVGWGRVKAKGLEPPMQESPAIRGNSTATVLWISATSVLAFFLVVWGITELATITAYSYGSTAADQQPNSQKAVVVNVTGQQWVWTFEYPDEQGITSPTLVVPVNRPVYFNVTSLDVVHNFWAVELGIKIDANPGAVTNTGVTPTKLGTFNIRCAELCGLHHAYMETTVKVVTPEEYQAWVREMGGKRMA